MGDRWVLRRAGIVNVYQYGDETLHFAGGRLLLRGVNGSGKSTAMNMLLPFLLEADTRRIDAAGEQSGVLRSWMLSGRDEQQPVGYLWIELERGDEHLTFGCGIRANRSTDRVTTWWFVTPRRPGVDLALVENRTPLSIDALRAALGPNAVYAHEQRSAYRAEVRNRLYGGVDVDQHLRLLHVVRNPRVGDRIDLDLPEYLTDALPQLSELALDDAAQPLEDLEEHRRNVEDLSRTASALEALDAVYRNYACTELSRRAGDLLALTDEHGTREREAARARRRLEEARTRRQTTDVLVDQHEAEQRRLGREIEALKARDAYKAGAGELEPLRRLVASLEAELVQIEGDAADRLRRQRTTYRAVEAARRRAESDVGSFGRALTELSELLIDAAVPARAPAAPAPATRTVPATDHDGDPVSQESDAPGEPTLVPVEALDVDPVRRGLADVRGGIATRRGEVAEVRATLDAVERAERRLGRAEDAWRTAEQDAERARETFDQLHRRRDEVVDGWRHELLAWVGRLDEHRRAHGLAAVDGALPADLAGERDTVTAELHEHAQEVVEHHQARRAELAARRAGEAEAVAELERRLAELRARRFPEPPSTPWQRPDRAPCLADLIDFQPGVDERSQAGLEAAMEAGGLLGAELAADGSLRLADGELVVAPGPPVSGSLATMLTVTAPDRMSGTVDARAVSRVLGAISTRAHDLHADTDGAPATVVTVDGRFRTGVLRGRHAKPVAEHIGVTARRATLERQRAEAQADLATATSRLAATDEELDECEALRRQAVQLRRELPPATQVARAVADLQAADEQLVHARDRRDRRHAAYLDAEGDHRDKVEHSRRTASTLGLPPDAKGLAGVAETLRAASHQCDRLGDGLRPLARSVDEWLGRQDDWGQAKRDVVEVTGRRDELRHRHEDEATTLATLEDAIGVEYQEIVAAIETSESDLERTTTALERSRQEHLEAHGAVERLVGGVETADTRCEEAGAECTAALPLLRDALATPGLLAAALREPADLADHRAPVVVTPDGPTDGPAAATSTTFPVVADSPAGARQLAEAVRERVPRPSPGPTTGEGLRQSLRQRRDSLGAGWDAEDRQPDEPLPIHVEVTGPLGRMPLPDAVDRVGAQQRSMTSLLTAKQQQALRNLLEGLVAREVAAKLHAARELVSRMNKRLNKVTTSHGIGVSLRWQRRDDIDGDLAETIGLLAKPPDLRSRDEDERLTAALSQRIADARREDPEASYRDLIAHVLDYRTWHRMAVVLHRPGRADERLTRRTALSEGEKKMVSYLPLFAAVAASCDALAEWDPAAPRFVLLDDAFAKVSEDNHAKLFGLLRELDLDFIATSERLWGTHDTIPELAITEVLRDADLGVIVLEHARWDGRRLEAVP